MMPPSTNMRLLTLVALLLVVVSMQCPTTSAFAPVLPPRTSLRSTTGMSALSIPMDSLVATLDQFWQSSPYEAAAVVCGIKAGAADLVAQTTVATDEGEEPGVQNLNSYANESVDMLDKTKSNNDITTTTTNKHNLSRSVAFIVYGVLYQGLSQEFIYNHLYPAWFGTSSADLAVIASKVAFDLLLQTTLVTLPVAYLIKGCIMHHETPAVSLRKYMQDIQNAQLLQKYYAIWGPVQCLTFSVVPEAYRITFVASVSFVWLILLSRISNCSEKDNTNAEHMVQVSNTE